ncbi:MAG: hypothetical protein KGO02_14310 [Alphaproteobacteria bacterium]|nr:hypothetical protein [Alphaproteobacteria bacterium]
MPLERICPLADKPVAPDMLIDVSGPLAEAVDGSNTSEHCSGYACGKARAHIVWSILRNGKTFGAGAMAAI